MFDDFICRVCRLPSSFVNNLLLSIFFFWQICLPLLATSVLIELLRYFDIFFSLSLILLSPSAIFLLSFEDYLYITSFFSDLSTSSFSCLQISVFGHRVLRLMPFISYRLSSHPSFPFINFLFFCFYLSIS